MKLLRYMRARLREQSTIAAIAAVIPTAVQLERPYSWIVVLIAAAVAMLPTSKTNSAAPEPANDR